MSQPVVLYGSAPAAVAAGKIVQLSDELALRNFTGHLLRLKELRFSFQNSAAGERYVPTAGVEIRIGNAPVTNGLVPVGAITWPVDVAAVVDAPVNSFPLRTAFTSPVYLSPEERIHVNVQIPATWGEAATSFRPFVSAVCQVEDDPRVADKGFLPWFAAYSATSRAAQGVYSEQSDPSVFQNNFPTSLYVDRFTLAWTLDPLRTQTIGNVTGAGTLDDFAFGAKLIRARLEDHLGNQVVRDPVPIAMLFDQTRRFWRMKSVLPPKGFFRLTLESDLRTAVLPTGGTIYPAPIVGMLAYRPAVTPAVKTLDPKSIGGVADVARALIGSGSPAIRIGAKSSTIRKASTIRVPGR